MSLNMFRSTRWLQANKVTSKGRISVSKLIQPCQHLDFHLLRRTTANEIRPTNQFLIPV